MLPTRIEGGERSIRLCSFPGFEDELRETETGVRWAREARALTEGLYGTAPRGTELEREARLLELRHGYTEETHHDYCAMTAAEDDASLTVIPEVLPVDLEVCVIGTYDSDRNGLTARRRRLGPNLIIYKGPASDIVARVGKDTSGFVTATVILAGIGSILVGIPFLFGGG